MTNIENTVELSWEDLVGKGLAESCLSRGLKVGTVLKLPEDAKTYEHEKCEIIGIDPNLRTVEVMGFIRPMEGSERPILIKVYQGGHMVPVMSHVYTPCHDKEYNARLAELNHVGILAA